MNEPLRVNVNSVAIADFFAYVVITPQGELNLAYGAAGKQSFAFACNLPRLAQKHRSRFRRHL